MWAETESEEILELLGHGGPTVSRKNMQGEGGEVGWDKEEEERNKGGEGCIKSWYCLLVPLLGSHPQRMV